jgi:peptidoglycan/xylan/chitin deacetylase (PgdA/CDA1 family)
VRKRRRRQCALSGERRDVVNAVGDANGLGVLRRFVTWAQGFVARRFAPLERRIGVITHVQTTVPAVALTFDDGPHPEWTPRVLEVLARHGARATFFMVGEMAARSPELVDRVAAAGHAIGNHSWNHPSFTAVSHAERTRQIERCERAIARHSRRLFRPPFGDLDWRSWLLLVRKRYRVIAWNVSASDWEPRDAEWIRETVAGQMQPGSIVLMHDQLFAFSASDRCSREDMLAALDALLVNAPFRFVTVPELLELGRPQGRFWRKTSELGWLRQLSSYGDLGFDYAEVSTPAAAHDA